MLLWNSFNLSFILKTNTFWSIYKIEIRMDRQGCKGSSICQHTWSHLFINVTLALGYIRTFLRILVDNMDCHENDAAGDDGILRLWRMKLDLARIWRLQPSPDPSPVAWSRLCSTARRSTSGVKTSVLTSPWCWDPSPDDLQAQLLTSSGLLTPRTVSCCSAAARCQAPTAPVSGWGSGGWRLNACKHVIYRRILTDDRLLDGWQQTLLNSWGYQDCPTQLYFIE